MPERIIRRTVQLMVGLLVCGWGLAFVIRSMLGASPWDVLTLGLINHVPVSFGTAAVVISVIVLLLWIPLRERPGIGTVLNALIVGPSTDLGLHLIPEAGVLWVQALFLAVGTVLFGLGSGLYIGAGFGSGPRDGLMTGLHRRFGLPIWVARTGLEVIVVSVGWVLGGIVGLGTLVFAVTIGPLCQFFIRVLSVPLSPSSLSTAGTVTGPIPIIGADQVAHSTDPPAPDAVPATNESSTPDSAADFPSDERLLRADDDDDDDDDRNDTAVTGG